MLLRWLLVALLVLKVKGQGTSAPVPQGEEHPASPCPRIFVYENERTWHTRWYGVITFDAVVNRPFNLTIRLDRKADLLGTWAGTVHSDDNEDFVLQHPAPTNGASRVSVRFFVNFPRGGPVPRLIGLWRDGLSLCGSGGGSQNTPPTTPVVPTRPPTRPPNRVTSQRPGNRPPPGVASQGTRPPHFNPTTTMLTRPNTRPTLYGPGTTPNPWHVTSQTTTRPNIHFPEPSSATTSTDECGVIDIRSVPFLVNAQSTYHGEWPWHAALYSADDGNPKYKCGATLVSRRAIITAAHCITNPNNGRTVERDKLIVYLGKHSLPYGWTVPEGIQTYTPDRIIRHPTYNTGNLTGDIAMIILGQDAAMTKYVRTICLWPRRETTIRSLEGKLGTVVGWGFDERNTPTSEMQKVSLPVRSYEECIRSNRDFFSRFLVDKTYCAGYTNGTSACNGDSGGGMVFMDQGRWYLRGIVSNGVPRKNNQFLCSTEHYTVFVDVAQYRNWILQNAPELNNDRT